jgi:hypothetical protein
MKMGVLLVKQHACSFQISLSTNTQWWSILLLVVRTTSVFTCFYFKVVFTCESRRRCEVWMEKKKLSKKSVWKNKQRTFRIGIGKQTVFSSHNFWHNLNFNETRSVLKFYFPRSSYVENRDREIGLALVIQASFGCADKPAEKHCCLIWCEKKISF